MLGEIKVDDHVDSLDVNTSCEQICQHNTHVSEHNVKNKVYTDVYLMHPIMGNSRRLLSISSSKMPHIFLAVPEELDAMLYITTGLSLCVSTLGLCGLGAPSTHYHYYPHVISATRW